MKTLFVTLILICAVGIISCKKSHDDVSKNLALIQHNWKIVSLNGEALRYVGTSDDYFNFSANNILYVHAGGNNDTSAYTLLSDAHTLAIYPITNGVKSLTAANYNINILSDTAFVISYHATPNTNSLDSLKR